MWLAFLFLCFALNPTPCGMIAFEEFTLNNGLRVLVHPDHTTSMAVLNIMYNVGSRDEDPEKTGFAHLFEHLMFGGSKNITDYDGQLQRVGGDNNAYTNTDVTNYYITLPAVNLETAFWLESDRMLSLSFDPEVLEVQRKVVIEEFKQRYLNQPYGDFWLHMRPMAYKNHPYRWATIGKEISHIENATMQNVKDFFFTHYRPNNAVMVVAGHVTKAQVEKLAQKWFGPIEPGPTQSRNLPREGVQTQARRQVIEAKVPQNAFYRTYHMGGRYDRNYYQTDLTSDVLGRGNSSRLYQALVKEQEMFTELQSYVTGSVDPGLVVVTGKLSQGVSLEEAEQGIDQVINDLRGAPISAEELEKVKNQAESTLVYSEVELLNRAVNLAGAALNGGSPHYANEEAELIRSVSVQQVYQQAQEVFRPENGNTILYQATT